MWVAAITARCGRFPTVVPGRHALVEGQGLHWEVAQARPVAHPPTGPAEAWFVRENHVFICRRGRWQACLFGCRCRAPPRLVCPVAEFRCWVELQEGASGVSRRQTEDAGVLAGCGLLGAESQRGEACLRCERLLVREFYAAGDQARALPLLHLQALAYRRCRVGEVYRRAVIEEGAHIAQRRRLQKVINHGARIVKNLRCSEHITPHLKDLKWPTLDQLVVDRDVAMLSRVLYCPHAPVSLRDQIAYRAEVSERETRATAAGSLQLPRVRTEHGGRSFPYRAVATWNGAGV